jgi:Na+-driven multidrug efflux pump
MRIQLSDHFTYKRLLRFTVPSVIMMLFTSVYGIVDGLFVSNFVGKTAFSAVNFIMPFLMMLATIGFMFGAGGSALISKTMGEGDYERANKQFSLFVVTNFVLSATLAILGIIFVREISAFLGASGQMLDDTVTYGRIILIALPAFSMQNAFQTFFVTAEKPKLGLFVTIGAGVTNMLLDALLVAVFPLGLVGAAIATSVSQCVGGLVPIVYFLLPNNSLLRLGKPVWDGRALVKAMTNGASELLNNVSMSLVSMLYNVQLLKYAGEDGVAAY